MLNLDFKRLFKTTFALILFSITRPMASVESPLVSGPEIKKVFISNDYSKWKEEIAKKLFPANYPRNHQILASLVTAKQDELLSKKIENANQDLQQSLMNFTERQNLRFVKNRDGRYIIPLPLRVNGQTVCNEPAQYLSNTAVLEGARSFFSQSILAEALKSINYEKENLVLNFQSGGQIGLAGIDFTQGNFGLTLDLNTFLKWFKLAILKKLHETLFSSDPNSVFRQTIAYNDSLNNGPLKILNDSARETLDEEKILIDEYNLKLNEASGLEKEIQQFEENGKFDAIQDKQTQLDDLYTKLSELKTKIDGCKIKVEQIRKQTDQELKKYPKVVDSLDSLNYGTNINKTIKKLMKETWCKDFVEEIKKGLTDVGIKFTEDQIDEVTGLPLPEVDPQKQTVKIHGTPLEVVYGLKIHWPIYKQFVHRINFELLDKLTKIKPFSPDAIGEARYNKAVLKTLLDAVEGRQIFEGLFENVADKKRPTIALLLQVLIESGFGLDGNVLDYFSALADPINKALGRQSCLTLCESCRESLAKENNVKEALFAIKVPSTDDFKMGFVYDKFSVTDQDGLVATSLQESKSQIKQALENHNSDLFSKAYVATRESTVKPCCYACSLVNTKGKRLGHFDQGFFALFDRFENGKPFYKLVKQEDIEKFNQLVQEDQNILAKIDENPLHLLLVNPAIFWAIVMGDSEFTVNYLACPDHIAQVIKWRNHARALMACLTQTIRAKIVNPQTANIEIPTLVLATNRQNFEKANTSELKPNLPSRVTAVTDLDGSMIEMSTGIDNDDTPASPRQDSPLPGPVEIEEGQMSLSAPVSGGDFQPAPVSPSPSPKSPVVPPLKLPATTKPSDLMESIRGADPRVRANVLTSMRISEIKSLKKLLTKWSGNNEDLPEDKTQLEQELVIAIKARLEDSFGPKYQTLLDLPKSASDIIAQEDPLWRNIENWNMFLDRVKQQFKVAGTLGKLDVPKKDSDQTTFKYLQRLIAEAMDKDLNKTREYLSKLKPPEGTKAKIEEELSSAKERKTSALELLENGDLVGAFDLYFKARTAQIFTPRPSSRQTPRSARGRAITTVDVEADSTQADGLASLVARPEGQPVIVPARRQSRVSQPKTLPENPSTSPSLRPGTIPPRPDDRPASRAVWGTPNAFIDESATPPTPPRRASSPLRTSLSRSSSRRRFSTGEDRGIFSQFGLGGQSSPTPTSPRRDPSPTDEDVFGVMAKSSDSLLDE